MRKLLVALMMVAFAATAFAADVKLSGTYEVNGNYKKNFALNDDEAAASFYDHDFDLWINAEAGKTFFKSRTELIDEEWKSDAEASTKAGQFNLERAWLGHNFGAATLEAGIMTGGAWGYAFGNDAGGKYRVKVTANAGAGKVIAFVQKNAEKSLNANGDAIKDAEKDDSDTYGLGYKGKFGGFMVAPLFTYTIDSTKGEALSTDDATKKMSFDLAAGGNFGAVGVEFEFDYDKVDVAAKDYNLYGVYVNVFGKVSGATVGFITAYGSYDDDTKKSYDFDDDFDSMMILGDEIQFNGGDDLAGSWLNKLYAEYDVNDKLTADAAFAYATSNVDDDDTKAWELDLGVTYKISKALKYSAGFGYANVDPDQGDAEKAMFLKHGLKFSF